LEAPKYNCGAPYLIFKRMEVGFGEGVSHSPLREGSGVPLPGHFLILGSLIAYFGAF